MNRDGGRPAGEAFEGFYARTAPSVWAYVARTSGDPALADDIVQDAFVRYLAHVRPELPEPQRKAFVFKIASRLLTDHFRRVRTLPLETADGPGAEGSSRGTRDILSPDLERLLASIPPRSRAILWLAYVEGYDHRDIAGIFGLRAASIKVMLFRLRRSVAERLREIGYHPEGRP